MQKRKRNSGLRVAMALMCACAATVTLMINHSSLHSSHTDNDEANTNAGSAATSTQSERILNSRALLKPNKKLELADYRLRNPNETAHGMVDQLDAKLNSTIKTPVTPSN